MKKLVFLLVFVSVLFLSSCKIVDNKDNDSTPSILWEVNKELLAIEIDSTFPEENIEQFKIEIEDLKKTNLEEFDNMKKLARLYWYIGRPGEGIVLYEKYLTKNPWTDVIYNNLGKLYESICKLDEKINIEYCNKAISNYQLVLDNYKKTTYYKYISLVYIKMWKKEKAQEFYNLYLEKWWKTDSIVEKQLNK